GLGKTPEAMGRLTRLVRLETAMVIDADGLNLLAAQKRWPGYFKAQAVLTPHPGEMSRLNKLLGRDKTPSDDDGRINNAVAAARASARGNRRDPAGDRAIREVNNFRMSSRGSLSDRGISGKGTPSPARDSSVA